MKTSFSENIIYWLWLYSKQMGARFPFMLAQLTFSLLIFSNLLSTVAIPFLTYTLLCNIMDNQPVMLNTEEVAFISIIIYWLIFVYITYKYNNKKYCIKEKGNRVIWLEKYCILTDYYNKISREQLKRHNKAFFIYLSISLLSTLICILLLIDTM